MSEEVTNTEVEYTDTEPFTLHPLGIPARAPKLLRPILFPYPILDLYTMQSRMEYIRKSRTGSIENNPDVIREYLKNNRSCYLFIGDTEFTGSMITLRWFEGKPMINRAPSEAHHSLMLWAMDNAYYQYIKVVDKYEKEAEKNPDLEFTTDEVSGKPVPMLNDDLLIETYKKIEEEVANGTI